MFLPTENADESNEIGPHTVGNPASDTAKLQLSSDKVTVVDDVEQGTSSTGDSQPCNMSQERSSASRHDESTHDIQATEIGNYLDYGDDSAGAYGGKAGGVVRKELLDIMVQGKIIRGRDTDYAAGCHSIRTNQRPPPTSPILFTGQMPFMPPNQSTEGNYHIRIMEKTL